jgi:hypothetical protein
VRRWVNHFGPKIAAGLRKRRPKPHTTWRLDEVYLKIDGRMVYLWRAGDAEGEVLDVLVQTSPRRLARWDSAHRSDGEFSREPPDEQIPADAMYTTRGRPPAAGPLRRLQWHARFRVWAAVRARRCSTHTQMALAA